MKEIRIWFIYTINSFQQTLSNRFNVLIFTTSKLLRIILFLIFLHFLFQGTKGLGGYSREQIIFFYLSFNLIDTLTQFLFREVYRFRSMVVKGDLDLILTKPLNPLIRVLLGGADALDFFILILIAASVIWYGIVNIPTNIFSWGLYILLLLNGLLISTSFHIFVLGFGILTTSIDNLILVYRDFTSILRIPVDLYIEPVRWALTFLIPLGIMITFPPKVLMGLLSFQNIFIAFIISFIFLFLSLKFWKHSLRDYSSASS